MQPIGRPLPSLASRLSAGRLRQYALRVYARGCQEARRRSPGGRRARGKVRPRRSPSGKFPSELGASCKLRGRVLSFPSPYDRMKKLKRGRNGIFPAATNLPRDADRRLCAARYRPWHLCGSILLKARTRRRLAARAVCACRALRSIVCPLLSADRWKWAIPISRGGFAEPAARRSGAGGAARA